ncbi:DeoR/GlpR family DNA-binding transcription regulator [Vreelandella zhanjiangensis]|uniref:DeoR/GlpR family DNA-binding transcription regulator n=1 Tax=Vreelandella zhanjiangensis TaxID=1121960 RepID=UPI00402AF959
MKVVKRRKAMLEAVRSGICNIEALCHYFNISEATVRRDLGALSREGLLVRTYGGAATSIGQREPELTLEQRRTRQGNIKMRLAECALGCIEDGDTLLLDGGTTTSALAARLNERKGLHVVTNNMAALPLLTQLPEGRITVLGGDLRTPSMTVYGPLAFETLSRLTVDRLFLSADGVTERGLCEASPDQAWLKEAMIARSAEVYVMADATKIGRASQQHWTPLPARWTLITDGDDDLTSIFAQHRATILRPR